MINIGRNKITFVKPKMYRVTHKEWGFRDDLTEIILSMVPDIPCNCKLIFFFVKSFNKILKEYI